MKILSAKQQRELDAFTIENESISSVDLMERAALKCFNWLISNYSKNDKFSIICGPGNNGGDGLVIARHLHKNKYHVECSVIAFSDKFSKDFLINESRLEECGLKLKIIKSEDNLNKIDFSDHVVVDAIFGTGLSRPAEGLPKEAIRLINSNAKEIVAIDMPSGMYCDDLHNNSDMIINANYTLSFQAPKLNFFFPETGNHVGRWEVLDIGLDQNKATKFNVRNFCLTTSMVHRYVKKRVAFSHKGTYGHAKIVAGSYGKIGACVLATKAALKVGSGLVSAIVPKCGVEILQQCVPPAMVEPNEGNLFLSGKLTNIDKTAVYAVGPGVGKSAITVTFIKSLFELIDSPLVIDADGLNILSDKSVLIKKIPSNSILTPHPKEFERLVGSFTDSYDRTQKQIEFSKQ
ncbi:MAG: NAD(P)H-hydrate epimerase, partial [Brumimicrobium sp.]